MNPQFNERCYRCGRKLKDVQQQLIGYGKTCAKRLGLVRIPVQKMSGVYHRWETPARIRSETLADMLALVDVLVPVEEIDGWTDLERVNAQVWAAAVHLRAGDNVVHVPPKPSILEGFPSVSSEMMKRGAIV